MEDTLEDRERYIKYLWRLNRLLVKERDNLKTAVKELNTALKHCEDAYYAMMVAESDAALEAGDAAKYQDAKDQHEAMMYEMGD